MRIGKSVYLPLFLLVAALAPAGCRQMIRESFKPPKVDVVDVGIDSDTLANPKNPWRFVLTLSVDNPNPYALNIAGIAYSGMIGTDVVAEGELADEFRIAPSGVTVVKAPVSLRPGAFQAAARRVLAKKTISWEFNGSVGIVTPVVGVVRIPFSKTGCYDLFYILKQMGIGFN
jgi:LEA14-like dessication related protein